MNWRLVVAIGLLGAGGCATGPKYVRPEAPVPPSFKEAGVWKPAEPNDEAARGAWWEIFGDPQLNALEARLEVSSNTLRAAQAQFDQARALVRSARADQVPQVLGAATASHDNHHVTDYLLRLDASYELDVWGRVRYAVAASRASAQASAADLEVVRLSLHAELAANYFAVRALDAEREILQSSVAAYQRALDLTRNRYQGGVASAVDVAQAEAQLETTRAQLIDLQASRAEVEHAIAALIGEPPSAISVPSRPLTGEPPPIPSGLPAGLLERRPDIAAAERRVAAANAQVGVAGASFFPALTLTGSTGFASAALLDLLRGVSGFWSAAPAAAMVLFDGGRRRSVSAQATAGYQRAVAVYRETALVAFREVEDQLATLRVLGEEATVQQAALAASERSLALSTTRYKGGIATYLEVITAQNTVLNNRRTAATILARRLTASVLLVKALGGGWDASTLPPR